MFELFSPSLAKRRAKAAAKASGPLKDFYAVPVQPDHTPASEIKALAIDIETTGLDPRTDTMLSIGFVPLDGETIVFSGAYHRVLAVKAEVGQSAVFHGITDDQLAAGMPVPDAVEATLKALAGRAMVCHFSRIETEFLSRVCERLYGAPLVTPVIDTLWLHDQIINQGFDSESRRGELRLWNARTRYGLPVYPAHGALTDAVACAELFLGHVAEMSLTKPQTLKSLSAG